MNNKQSFLWNFWIYRLHIFKLNESYINKTINNKNWVIIDLLIDGSFNRFYNNSLISNIVQVKRRDFEKWFLENKSKSKKYLFINSINHCKYEYRFIHYYGYKSYILKESKKNNKQG